MTSTLMILAASSDEAFVSQVTEIYIYDEKMTLPKSGRRTALNRCVLGLDNGVRLRLSL